MSQEQEAARGAGGPPAPGAGSVEADEDSLVMDLPSEAVDPSGRESGEAGPASAAPSGAEDEEKEFEPTVEMMMNDFDDERTLEEEEALDEDNQADTAAEVEALEQEGDMPLEELMKLYGYNAGAAGDDKDPEPPRPPHGPVEPAHSPKSGEKRPASPASEGGQLTIAGEDDDEEEDDEEEALGPAGGAKRGSMSPPPPAKKSKSELARFYYDEPGGRALRSSAPGGGLDDEEEESDGGAGGKSGEESDLEGRDYSWKKTIMIGPSFQASVPADMSTYDDTLPYENEDKLLWDPQLLTHEEVEKYLAHSSDAWPHNGVSTLPMGPHVRDDEQALHLLLQCGYNYEEALRRRRMNPATSQPAETMSLWSEEECRAFELGLRLYGKDFHMIHQQKVRTRSVGELVQFYYLWKKTERHDVFANATRLEKKKYTLHPGTTDYMDRFIDEQEQSNTTPSPNYHSLLYGTDSKKGFSINNGSSYSMRPSENGSTNGSIPSSGVFAVQTHPEVIQSTPPGPNPNLQPKAAHPSETD